MVGDKKNNESESKSEIYDVLKAALKDLTALEGRVKALEEHLRSLDHGNEGGNDIRDGGWFD